MVLNSFKRIEKKKKRFPTQYPSRVIFVSSPFRIDSALFLFSLLRRRLHCFRYFLLSPNVETEKSNTGREEKAFVSQCRWNAPKNVPEGKRPSKLDTLPSVFATKVATGRLKMNETLFQVNIELSVCCHCSFRSEVAFVSPLIKLELSPWSVAQLQNENDSRFRPFPRVIKFPGILFERETRPSAHTHSVAGIKVNFPFFTAQQIFHLITK